ncbi:MAG: hypothetical protein WBK91_05105 [Alphaproteobacteria bacterium]
MQADCGYACYKHAVGALERTNPRPLRGDGYSFNMLISPSVLHLGDLMNISSNGQNLRKNMEAANELREQYRKDDAQFVRPFEDFAQATDKLSIDVALTIFKTCSWLNAGGIIAIPTVKGLFQFPSTATPQDLLYSAIFFILGLVASASSAILGFFALVGRADRSFASAESYRMKNKMHYYPDPLTEKDRYEYINSQHVQENKCHGVFLRFKITSIIAIIISLVCFIVGSWVGASTIYTVIKNNGNQPIILKDLTVPTPLVPSPPTPQPSTNDTQSAPGSK